MVPGPARLRAPAGGEVSGAAVAFLATLHSMAPVPQSKGAPPSPEAEDVIAAPETGSAPIEPSAPDLLTPADAPPWPFNVPFTDIRPEQAAKSGPSTDAIEEATIAPASLANTPRPTLAVTTTTSVVPAFQAATMSVDPLAPAPAVYASTGLDAPPRDRPLAVPVVAAGIGAAGNTVAAPSPTTGLGGVQAIGPSLMPLASRQGAKPTEPTEPEIAQIRQPDRATQMEAPPSTAASTPPAAADTRHSGIMDGMGSVETMNDLTFGVGPVGPDSDTAARLTGGVLTGHTASPAETARQIAPQIAAVLSSGKQGTTEIALNPEELGKVRIQLSGVDQTMTVAILAERPETADLMRRHIDTLVQEFRALGYTDVRFEFGRQPDSGAGGQPSGQGPDEPPTGQQAGRDAGAEQPNIWDAATAQPLNSRRGDGTGLDLRL